MELIPDMAERVTAVTDFMMAIIAVIGIAKFRRELAASPWKINLWTAVYTLFIIAAVVGTYHHGLKLSDAAYNNSWTVIFLSLGIMIGLFVVGVTEDLFGGKVSKPLLPVMIVVALAFFGYSWNQGQDFSLFIAYEALALLTAMIGYAWLAFKKAPGGLQMAIGVFITIVAAVVQVTGAITYTLIVPFDHNANYHLIQMVGVFFLTTGIVRSTQAAQGSK